MSGYEHELTEYEQAQLRYGCAAIRVALHAFIDLFDGTDIDIGALRTAIAATEGEIEKLCP